MNKSLTVMTSVLLLLVVAPAALAESLEMQVSTGQQPSNRISSCPDTVLSDIDVFITNLGGETDTVSLTLDWPADLGFILPFKTLASGESSFINPFWITLPYTLEPGTYHARVTAESSVTGDIVSEDIEIEVMMCHAVALNIEDDTENSCRETSQPVSYDIDIFNDGKFTETFDLSASVEWADFSSDRVTISPEGSETVSLVLTPPSDLSAGSHTVFITARSTESYAETTSSVEIEAIDCFDFDVSIDPQTQTTCLGVGSDFELIVTNNGGGEDEYSLTVPEWVFPEETSFVLDAGSEKIIMLTVLPEELGIKTFDVSVESVRDQTASPKTVTGTISVEECRGVAVIAAPSKVDTCKGEELEFVVSVKNTGSQVGLFEVTSTFGVLDSDSLELNAGESKSVELTVDTSELPDGTVTIDVTAKDGPIDDTASIEVNVQDCFAAELNVQPDEVTICPGATIPYTIRITNTGKETDTYTVEYADQTKTVTLEPGDFEALIYDFQIPFIEEGRYLFTVEVDSVGGESLLDESEINMRSSDTCYGVVLEDDAGIVEVGKATTVEIKVLNTGEQSETFEISKTDGPDWVFIEPSTVKVAGGEEELVFLYLSPGFGTAQGDYTVDIKATSANAEDVLTVMIIVPEDITEVEIPTEPPEEPEGNGDQPAEEENVSINVTTPDDDGSPITGGAIEDRPFWKTAAVALIALIIVAILVLRFILLLKK